jgi:hypothetical protein
MQKNNRNWIIIIILVLIILFLIPQGFMYGPGKGMHSGYGKMGYDMMGYGKMGYGMMGYGLMGFGWLIPVIFLILIIAAGVWLGNVFSARGHRHGHRPKAVCSNCSKPIATDWSTCPYCGTPVEKE